MDAQALKHTWLPYLEETKSWDQRGPMDERDARRPKVATEMRALLDGFFAQGDLQRFREEFDRKVKNEWDVFGLKGASGAMFLNKLTKHLLAESGVTEALQNCLRLPEGPEDGRRKMRELYTYLDGQIRSGAVSAQQIQPNRLPNFVSALWHVQDHAAWPIYFVSAREALAGEGLFEKGEDPVDSYFRFRDVYLDVCRVLGVDTWTLERVCLWWDSRDNEESVPVLEPLPEPEPEATSQRVWLMAPGPGAKMWETFRDEGIIAMGGADLGPLTDYDSPDAFFQRLAKKRPDGSPRPTNDARGFYEFAYEMQPGDLIFAKRGRHGVVGYGVIQSDYKHVPERGEYVHVREVDWKADKEVQRDAAFVMKTLTEIGRYPGLTQELKEAFGIEDDASEGTDEDSQAPRGEVYTLDSATSEVFLPREEIQEALTLLRYKKNIILQGPPGVGKSFFAKRLAYLLLGYTDRSYVDMVQFHQSYSYEDFVQGYRPAPGGGFIRKDGPFLRFCDRALQDADNPYVLIIDEINRGNLSKILGELMMLIEHDKRDPRWAVSLTYSEKNEAPFYVPPNVHIIGTMNTADRSLAMVDYALRRRFAFVDVKPGFETAGFTTNLRRLGGAPELAKRIRARFAALNDEIARDTNLGWGFCVGHSYFCPVDGSSLDDEWYERVITTEIRPLLREYWFDNHERVAGHVVSLLADE